VLIIGQPGPGKSHTAKAIAHAAIQAGLPLPAGKNRPSLRTSLPLRRPANEKNLKNYSVRQTFWS